MYNGVALQSATSHYFGDGFAKAFNMTYMDKDNKQQYMYQTSWGLTTRVIGAMIMTHGDDHGLVLPPNIAPVKVVIVPIGKNNEEVVEKSYEIARNLNLKGITTRVDNSEKSPGFRFAENEMKGIPVRIEIGPRDLENGKCILARRDTLEKIDTSLENVEDEVIRLLLEIQETMFLRAQTRRDAMTNTATTKEEMNKIIEENSGFVIAPWCGSRECEDIIKEEFGITSRCIPFDGSETTGKCVCCANKAKYNVYWGKQY